MKSIIARSIACVLLLVFHAVAFAADAPFDLVITNGHIIDGTGSPWYSGDIGIRNGRIAAIGNLAAAERKRTVDAKSKVVAPGFVDMLGQSEATILVDPRLPSKIYQGITTEITGEGGSRRLRTLQDQSRLADVPSIFRAPRKAGHGDQSRQLRGRDSGAANGAG